MKHKLKCWPIFFGDLENGSKTFEFRKNDRNYHVGDTLEIHEYDDYTETYSGKILLFDVTYVLVNASLMGLTHLPPGYCIMSIKPNLTTETIKENI